MYKVQFHNGEWRTYNCRQPDEIRAIAKRRGWIITFMVKEY